MEKLKITLVAQRIGVSTQAVYKKLQKVGNTLSPYLIKENGSTFFNSDGMEELSALFGKRLSEPVSTVTNQVDKTINILEKELERKQETINQLISLNEETRRRSDTIIMKLTNQVNEFQKVIEFRNTILNAEPPRTLKPWQPSTAIDPLQGKSFLARLWVKIFEPEKLRRFDF